jgi:hypothetical protein
MRSDAAPHRPRTTGRVVQGSSASQAPAGTRQNSQQSVHVHRASIALRRSPPHRESICMHSGIVNRNRFPGRRPLHFLSQALLPAQTVFAEYRYDFDISSRTRNKPLGQAVPAGSEKWILKKRGGRTVAQRAQRTADPPRGASWRLLQSPRPGDEGTRCVRPCQVARVGKRYATATAAGRAPLLLSVHRPG